MIPETRQSTIFAMAILSMFGVVAWSSLATAQLAPWQQPPGAAQKSPGESPVPASPGAALSAVGDRSSAVISPTDGQGQTPGDAGGAEHSPVPWQSEDYEQDRTPLGLEPGAVLRRAYEGAHDRLWIRGEFLAWWAKGFATPPLLTSSLSGTSQTQAGIVGAAGTNVLFGGSDLGGGFEPGERVTFGVWLDGGQTAGWEASYLALNRQTAYYSANGITTPILARPFFNVETGQNDAEVINYPGQQSGVFSAASASALQAAEFLARRNWLRQPDATVDIVGGYRYQQLDDHLALDDSLSFSSSQSGFPAGSLVQQSDRFDARNVFQGGVLGMITSLHRQNWSFDTSLKIGVGATRSRVAIVGGTTTAVPGQAMTLLPGGLLALPSNIGVYDSRQFSLAPELGLTLGYDLSPHLRATVGYDLFYWTAVARAGDQIDTNIDPRQLPPAAASYSPLPQFQLHTSDYWAQGVNLGLDWRF